MQKFLKPNFILNQKTSTDTYMEFSVQVMEKRLATTIGNSIRRALVEAVPGVAVYAVRIKGVNHEFSTINGVQENVLEIILNIKKLVLGFDINDLSEEDLPNLTLSVTGKAVVLASDIVCPTGIRIVNCDLIIAHTTDRNELFEVEFFIKKLYGYTSDKENKKLVNNAIGVLAIDSDYCPIVKSSFHVEPITKTIKGMECAKLTIALETNGSIDPCSAVAMAARVLSVYFDFFTTLRESVRNFEVIDFSDHKLNEELLTMPIEDLALGNRAYKALKLDGIKTLGEITQRSIEEIAEIKNLGKKSVDEIEACVLAKGLSLSRKL